MLTYSKKTRNTTLVLSALLLGLVAAQGSSCLAADQVKQAGGLRSSTILTLDHLKNGSYLIPDLACGYTTVNLKDGQGENEGVQVVFGRAIFGYLAGEKRPTAIVYLAYSTPELGWAQQLVFVKPQKGKLIQVAEYPLDDRDQLQDIAIKKGEVMVETTGHGAADSKLTRIKVAQSKGGCLLEVSQSAEDTHGQVSARSNLAPYLDSVEQRISNTWSPLSKDRGEHVVVAFRIQPSGDVADVHVRTSSEVASADQAAIEAVSQAAPFPPLPDKESLSVCLDFQAGVSLEPQPYGHVYR